MSKVSIIVPIFNGSRYLPAFLDSLASALPENSQIIFVDDGSTENVLEIIPEFSKASEVIKIRNDQNYGHSVAVNKGFEKSIGDYNIELNTDLILDSNCIHKMIELINELPNVGIVGSKLIFPTTGLTQHIGMTFGFHTRRKIFSELNSDHPLCCKTRQMQILAGATVAMTKRLLNEIGPLDEMFFNNNEDLDHCMRAHLLGYKNYTCAESIAYHWESQSGPARFAKISESDAVFWSKHKETYQVDLDQFFKESIEEVINLNGDLVDYDFELINLCKSNDEKIILKVLEIYWPFITKKLRDYRQYNNPQKNIWLPMVLPHSLQENPKPFIYLVDHFRQLSENFSWFQNRKRLVKDELIVDLNGCSITTSDFL